MSGSIVQRHIVSALAPRPPPVARQLDPSLVSGISHQRNYGNSMNHGVSGVNQGGVFTQRQLLR